MSNRAKSWEIDYRSHQYPNTSPPTSNSFMATIGECISECRSDRNQNLCQSNILPWPHHDSSSWQRTKIQLTQ